MKKDLFTESVRLSKVTKEVRDIFEMWNYKEIFLPTLEPYHEYLRKGLKTATYDEFFLIKPDMTSQITANLKDRRKLRLFYLSEVLDGKSGEWQGGIEFIGGKKRQMDIEVLSVVITTLERLGISDFYVDIGSLGVWRDSINDVPEYEEVIFDALKNRNFGLIEELNLGDEKIEELWDLFNFRGKTSGVENIDDILRTMDDDRIFIDFGTVRPLPYYDDLIFEVYSPRLGYPLGAGGGYRVNSQVACGFAFKLKGLLSLYESEMVEKKREEVAGDTKETYDKARAMVYRGKHIEVID
ncbi:MAG: ATP phosphoribosyltransferase regulatory subunit [Thermoplasmata archaeon]